MICQATLTVKTQLQKDVNIIKKNIKKLFENVEINQKNLLSQISKIYIKYYSENINLKLFENVEINQKISYLKSVNIYERIWWSTNVHDMSSHTHSENPTPVRCKYYKENIKKLFENVEINQKNPWSQISKYIWKEYDDQPMCMICQATLTVKNPTPVRCKYYKEKYKENYLKMLKINKKIILSQSSKYI